MTNPSPLNDEQRADLIAYLDGELQGEAAQAIAARLNLDPKARAEAEALKRTWELLDYLPRQEPSPNFTHRTVERLTALREPPRRRWRPWLAGVGWAAGVLVALAAGFGGVRYFAPDPHRNDEQLVHDLRVIDNERLYEPIDDIDFLMELSGPDLFGDDSPGS